MNELTKYEVVFILARTKEKCAVEAQAEISNRNPFDFNGVRISSCVFIASFLSTVWKTMVSNCLNCPKEKRE